LLGLGLLTGHWPLLTGHWAEVIVNFLKVGQY
jgi:hypothetical protein